MARVGSGAGGGGAVDRLRPSLDADGTNVYAGTRLRRTSPGIPQADHVAKWNGSAWSALGANAAGTDGLFPASDARSTR